MSDSNIQGQLNDLQSQISELQKSITHKSSPSRLKAEHKYYKSLTPFSLRFKKSEKELWDYVSSQPNKSQYLKSLIAKDLGYMNWSHYEGKVPTEEMLQKWNKTMKDRREFIDKFFAFTLDELEDYVSNNELSDEEWKNIKKLFEFNNKVSVTACEALNIGALPLNAWSKEVMLTKLKDICKKEDRDYDISLCNLSEKELQDKLLSKSHLIGQNSTLDKNIDFYKINC